MILHCRHWSALLATQPTPAAWAAPRKALLPPRPSPFVLSRRFEADYADALHPLCERHIRVERLEAPSGGWVAHFSGTDVGPPGIGQTVKIGCDEEAIKMYKLRDWAFDAKISDDGERIDAGDGVHVGAWRADQPAKDGGTWSGIRWNDGNKWEVEGGPLVDLAERPS